MRDRHFVLLAAGVVLLASIVFAGTRAGSATTNKVRLSSGVITIHSSSGFDIAAFNPTGRNAKATIHLTEFGGATDATGDVTLPVSAHFAQNDHVNCTGAVDCDLAVTVITSPKVQMTIRYFPPSSGSPEKHTMFPGDWQRY